MMDNKLSELSKPVAWMHRQLDISKSNSDKADLSGDVQARYSDALYSQEYVCALLADNERLASDLVARNGEIEGLKKLATELEAKLDTPVPVPSFDCYKPDVARELQEGFKNTVRAAGFTVDGNE
jgi:hypothetical protein